MRVAIEAAHRSASHSGGLARYTAELSLALARCFPGRRVLPSPISPSACRAAPRQSQARRRPAQPPGAPLVALGPRSRTEPPGADLVHGPDFAVPYMPRRPSVLTLHDLSPWMDRALASCRRPRPPPHAVLLELGIATMIITPSESGAQAGHRALPPAPGPRRGRSRSRRALVAAACESAARQPRRISSSWARSSRARICPTGGGLARSAPRVMPSIWCSPAAAAPMFAAHPRGARPAPCSAKSRTRTARRCTPARWPSSTRRSTKASACRCWRPCSAAPP